MLFISPDFPKGPLEPLPTPTTSIEPIQGYNNNSLPLKDPLNYIQSKWKKLT